MARPDRAFAQLNSPRNGIGRSTSAKIYATLSLAPRSSRLSKKNRCQDWFPRCAALGWLGLDGIERTKVFEGGTTVMSTLAVVEEILRETAVPMSVREIVERAGARLPSKSKTPDTVVARDLSMDIKKKGEGSLFIRTSPGRYTLRSLAGAVATAASAAATPATAAGDPAQLAARAGAPAPAAAAASTPLAALPARKPAIAATPASSSASPARARTDSDVGNGLAG
ncbi:MAG: winged helix-turn-helix domain-containing protein [Kofleriaceae bacterium]